MHFRLRLSLPAKTKTETLETLIVDGLRREIQNLNLPKGTRLPPVRVLQHQLGVAKGTIQRAYDELMARGLIESKERSGYFVADSHEAELAAELKAVRTEAAPLAVAPCSTYAAYLEQTPLHASSAQIAKELLPLEPFARALRNTTKKRTLQHRFPEPQGYGPLREALAHRMKKRGMDVKSENIVTGPGSTYFLDAILNLLPQGNIGIENPGYARFHAILEQRHKSFERIAFPVHPFDGINEHQWSDLAARYQPKILLLTTAFQNPTGFSYSAHEMEAIVRLSSQHGIPLLEDDWGSEMMSHSEYQRTFRSLGGENVLYMNSFTKKIAEHVRVGFLVGDKKTVSALTGWKSRSLGMTPLWLEAAVCEMLELGHYDASLKQMQKALDARYHFCLKKLDELMPKGVTWTRPGGGTVLWIELPESVLSENIQQDMMQKGILISCATDSFAEKKGRNGFKFGYGSLTHQEIQHVLETVAESLSS